MMKINGKRTLMYSILVVMAIFALLPILWTVSTSLKPFAEAVSYPPKLFFFSPTLDNYKTILTHSLMPLYLINSSIVALGAVGLTLLLGVHAAYATSRFIFKGRNTILMIILFTAMIPGISILVPLYIMISKLGLYDTYLVLIIANTAYCLPLVIWLLRGFFEAIPKHLEDAAVIDGCSRIKAFYLILLPLTRPGLAAAAIYIFIVTWNDFLFGFIFTTNESRRVAQVGLYHFITGFGIEWHKLSAAVVLGLFPVVIFFLFLEKYFVRGITAGALKG